MGRRPGQIVKRGPGVYQVRIFIRKDHDGRHWRHETVHGKRKDAQTLLNNWLKEKDAGGIVKPTKETVEAYLKRWLEAAGPARANTRHEYEAIIDRYLVPALGKIRLDALRASDVQKLYNDMTTRGLSPRTVWYAHTVLRVALKQAVAWRNLSATPLDGVKLPKTKKREMHALSPEQAAAFLAEAEKRPHGLLFAFLLATGLRPSEALALRWKDTDLKAGRVTVQRVLLSTGARGTFADPKTDHSRRTIPVPNGLVKKLRAHYLAAGRPHGDALLFPGEQGQPLDEHNLAKRHFKPILKAAKLPEAIRLYDLRHSCATLLLSAGVNPKIVTERLGHANIKLTLDVYSHVLPNMQQEAAAKLDAMLFGGPAAARRS